MRAIVLVLMLAIAGAVVWLLRPTHDELATERQFNAALAAYERGDSSQLDDATRAAESEPVFAEHAQVLKAVAAMSAGLPESALQRLAALPHDGPLRPVVLLFEGEALHRLQRVPESEAVFRQVATEFPELPSAHRWLGVIYYDLGAYDAAIAELDILVELTPNDYRPHRLLALMHQDFERYGEALPHFERALELAPPADVEAAVRVDYARSLVALRRYDEALAALRDVPASAASQVVIAQCHWNSSRRDEAKELLASARSLDPTIREAYLLEADMRSAEGDVEGALEVMREAVQAHPHDAQCRYRFALLLEQSGHSEESAREMAIWEETNQLATRLTELNMQAVRDPRNSEVRDEIAELCETLGKHELARVWREAAESCRTGTAPPPGARPAPVE